MEAQANDEEAARAILATMGDEAPDPVERWSEWSPEVDQLARIADWLQALNRSVTASTGAKPAAFKPAVRPVSAMQRLRRENRREQHRALVARVLQR